MEGYKQELLSENNNSLFFVRSLLTLLCICFVVSKMHFYANTNYKSLLLLSNEKKQ